MALTYDIRSDIRFKQGKEEGKEEKLIENVKGLISIELSPENIAKALNVSIDFVRKIAKSMKK